MTIKDIARESGYSVGTVSRVLNGAPGVSETAREAVMEVVNKHHFQINNNAKLLKQQTSEGIAIIIKGAQNMLFVSIVELIQTMVEKRGYVCMVFYISEDDNEVKQAYRVCKERRPLGILFLGNNWEYLRQSFHLIKVPCVLVTNSAEGIEFENLSSVCTDDKAAAKTAVDYLFSMGHKDIGIIGANTAKSPTVLRRYLGIRESFENHHIPFNEERQYIISHFSVSEGYYAMERLLDRMPELTAVFAMSDVTAIGAIRAIHDRGLRVPEDISVMGFDGIDIGRYMVPRLVTIRQYREVIAVRSVEILLSCIEGFSKSIYEVESFHLVPGESVQARKN